MSAIVVLYVVKSADLPAITAADDVWAAIQRAGRRVEEDYCSTTTWTSTTRRPATRCRRP